VCRFIEIGFVTVFAGDSQGLVTDDLSSIPCFCRVTFRALDVSMGPAQSKSRAGAVIESNALPGLCVMARFTPCCSPFDELAEVRILVAGCAHGRKACILHGIALSVTFHALHAGVPSFKRECGFAVIKEK
jgi:hypothetical protein